MQRDRVTEAQRSVEAEVVRHPAGRRARDAIGAALLLFAIGLILRGPAAAQQLPDLLLYGGPRQNQFLGCLNCSAYDGNSVSNQYGPHGSEYGPSSIFNPYGTYGSAYSPYSPCNAFATDPPVVVGRNGARHGVLTLNEFHRDAARSQDLRAWLQDVCRGR